MEVKEELSIKQRLDKIHLKTQICVRYHST